MSKYSAPLHAIASTILVLNGENSFESRVQHDAAGDVVVLPPVPLLGVDHRRRVQCESRQSVILETAIEGVGLGPGHRGLLPFLA